MAEEQKQAVVCVFCGASNGTTSVHLEAARSLARTFHKNNIKLVYGGGTVGVMGVLAETLVSLSGKDSVHGIIPRPLLKYERNYTENGTLDPREAIDENKYGRTTVVPDMHTRKQNFATEVMAGGPGSGFVALTGGFGTLEELMEVVTWNQLGIHGSAIVVFNVEGFWDGILAWIKTAVEQGFIKEANAGILVEAKTSEEVVGRLRDYRKSDERFKLEWGEK